MSRHTKLRAAVHKSSKKPSREKSAPSTVPIFSGRPSLSSDIGPRWKENNKPTPLVPGRTTMKRRLCDLWGRSHSNYTDSIRKGKAGWRFGSQFRRRQPCGSSQAAGDHSRAIKKGKESEQARTPVGGYGPPRPDNNVSFQFRRIRPWALIPERGLTLIHR